MQNNTNKKPTPKLVLRKKPKSATNIPIYKYAIHLKPEENCSWPYLEIPDSKTNELQFLETKGNKKHWFSSPQIFIIYPSSIGTIKAVFDAIKPKEKYPFTFEGTPQQCLDLINEIKAQIVKVNNYESGLYTKLSNPSPPKHSIFLLPIEGDEAANFRLETKSTILEEIKFNVENKKLNFIKFGKNKFPLERTDSINKFGPKIFESLDTNLRSRITIDSNIPNHLTFTGTDAECEQSVNSIIASLEKISQAQQVAAHKPQEVSPTALEKPQNVAAQPQTRRENLTENVFALEALPGSSDAAAPIKPEATPTKSAKFDIDMLLKQFDDGDLCNISGNETRTLKQNIIEAVGLFNNAQPSLTEKITLREAPNSDSFQIDCPTDLFRRLVNFIKDDFFPKQRQKTVNYTPETVGGSIKEYLQQHGLVATATKETPHAVKDIATTTAEFFPALRPSENDPSSDNKPTTPTLKEGG